MPKAKESSYISELLKGGLIGSIAFMLLTVGICVLLYKSNLSRNTYLPLLMITSALSGITSGFSAVRKRRENGLINGMSASIIPTTIILVAMSVAYKGFNVFEIVVAVCCIMGGAVGGICTVNIKKKRKTIKKR